jgi:galactokinase
MREILNAIYGLEEQELDAQQARYARAVQQFEERFGRPTALVRTPGRINLIGEHTDYNGGFVLPIALDKDILCVVRPRRDTQIRVANIEPEFPDIAFELSSDIPPAPHGDWSNYFRGAAQEICRRFGERTALGGFDGLISGAPPHGVPRGSGLSSSTALTVTAALALVTLNGIDVARADLAHLCSEAEWYVGTRGGMMDQFSALLSRRDHALFLDCRPSPEGVYTLDHVPVPGTVQIVLLDSEVHHQNVRGTFKLLQARFPGIASLRDATPDALGMEPSAFWATIGEMLPARATASELVARGLDRAWLDALIADHRLAPGAAFEVLPRCRHVISENARVLDGVAALRAGRVQAFGRLMDAAHASMSGDYGASCPEVDALVEIVRRQPGVLGARITGAGWGGGVAALVQRGSTGWPEAVRTAYRQATGLETRIYVCRPGDGAGRVSF